jgi:hypothetical protein
MPDQDHVREVFPLQHSHNVVYVGLERYLSIEQVRSFAEAGIGRCVDTVRLSVEPVGDLSPAPTPVPATVDKNKRCHLDTPFCRRLMGSGVPHWNPLWLYICQTGMLDGQAF